MRKYLRQIAKNRLDAMGVGNVNRAMSKEQDGTKNWRRAVTGNTGETAEAAQMKAGRILQRMRRDSGQTKGYIKRRASA
jgi:hypothetical protein